MRTKKTEATVKYSVLADKENLFASTYMTYLPTEEELAALLKEGCEEVEEERWRKREAAGEFSDGDSE